MVTNINIFVDLRREERSRAQHTTNARRQHASNSQKPRSPLRSMIRLRLSWLLSATKLPGLIWCDFALLGGWIGLFYGFFSTMTASMLCSTYYGWISGPGIYLPYTILGNATTEKNLKEQGTLMCIASACMQFIAKSKAQGMNQEWIHCVWCCGLGSSCENIIMKSITTVSEWASAWYKLLGVSL